MLSKKQKLIFATALILLSGIVLAVFFIREQQETRQRAAPSANGTVSGSLRKWQPMSISFAGPLAQETDNSPNPFLNYRLQVEFTGPSGQKYNVPGFFDGNNPDLSALPQLAGEVAAATNKVFQESGGQVVVEAENFYQQTQTSARQWYEMTTTQTPNIPPDPDGNHASTAGNGAYMEILPDTRVTADDPLIEGQNFSGGGGQVAIISYRVNFQTSGRYYVWVRAHVPGPEDNGLHVGIDGTWPASGLRMQWCGATTWTWYSAQRTDANHCGEPGLIYIDVPTPGEHTISFSMREDGFEMDRWLMTKTPGFNVSGIGPAESSGVGGSTGTPIPTSGQATPTPTSSSGPSSTWKVRFSPDQAGTWTYKASFRQGSNVAIDSSPTAGSPVSFDGATGTFSVSDRDPSAPGFLKWGRLEYVGGHYLKFRDGSYWIKGGADSPENFMGYAGFDNTPTAKHTFSPHVQDWVNGNPIFNTNSPDGGKGLIGAVNYLASRNVNSVYFLPMNIGGDGKDTSPFISVTNWSGGSGNDKLHYDISKLAQWERAFRYMQEKGIHLHFVLNEAEELNKRELDNATLGTERKLFYRELIARFGHHNSLQWNISEEYDFQLPLSPDTVKQWAGYIQNLDPYKHPITVHQIGDPNVVWSYFVGDPRFSLTSFQSSPANGAAVEQWRTKTAAAGRPITISFDEVLATNLNNMDSQRKDILWPTYLSGGQIEWFIGAEDQNLEDFRRYDPLWNYTWYARKFMEEIPFWEMTPNDGLLTGVSNRQVMAKQGQYYAIYLPNASTTGALNLSGTSGTFQKRWYNPRTGNFEGTATTVNGGGSHSLGSPPNTASEDWVVLLKNMSLPSNTPTPTTNPNQPTFTPSPTTGQSTPTPTPGTGGGGQSITSFTLVNADNEQDIQTLTQSATLSLSSLPTQNLNIRANTSPSTVGSVQMTLSGAMSQSITESVAPYALFGDTSGNYNIWTPQTGSYTLTARPYTGSGASGTQGQQTTITFTVTQSGVTPTPTKTPTPTQATATSTPTRTPTPQPNSTQIQLTLKLHGIGNGGDSVNPNGVGNTNPLNPQRAVTVQVLDGSSNVVLSRDGVVNYNTGTGIFTGSVNMGTTLASGQYLVRVKSPKYLQRGVPGIKTITQGTTNNMEILDLIVGDVNNDNLLNILDYNLISDCYSDLAPPISCSDPEKKASTDITDDGSVNQFDYNLFIRELSVRSGE